MNILLRFLLIGGLLVGARQHTLAGRVDTVLVNSAAMQKSLKCVVITPDQYSSATAKHYPVVYVLHGHGGNYNSWISKVSALASLSDRYQQIIVCPDGANSWYFDSPLNPALRYETFVGTELPAYIDATYRSMPDRQHRAITGLSMGGHGALYLAIRHRDTFGQAGSLSGGVDIRPFPNNWNIKDALGEEATNAANWERNTVINVADSLRNGELRLLIECGISDFFIDVNRALHKKLMQQKIDHDYAERPGAHTWTYWGGNIENHLLFFQKGFAQ